MTSTADLYSHAKALATTLDENFLELGRTLRELQEQSPDDFQQFLNHAGMGKRKAYYLIEIDETFSKIPVPKARLRRIGWTKLATLTKYINKGNYGDLLKMAEANKARDLDLLLRGEQPISNAHCVLLYLSPSDYQTLRDALLKHGAQTAARGLLNKEQALMNLIKQKSPKK